MIHRFNPAESIIFQQGRAGFNGPAGFVGTVVGPNFVGCLGCLEGRHPTTFDLKSVENG